MNEKLIILLCEIMLIGGVAAAGVAILAAAWFDLRHIARRQRLRQTYARLRRPRQPQLTVAICVRHDSPSIDTCLNSIFRSYYHNYHVIVIDATSHGAMKQHIRTYVGKHPARRSVITVKQTSIDPSRCLQQICASMPGDELVLVMRAPATLQPGALKQAVTYYIDNPRIGALHLHQQPILPPRIDTLVPRFVRITQHTIAKACDIVRVKPPTSFDAPIVYRASMLATSAPSKKRFYRYAADITTQVPPSHPLRPETTVQIIAALLLVLVLLGSATYCIYTAATLRSNILLLLSWGSVTFVLAVAVWSDESLPIRQKYELTFVLPCMYLLLYLTMAWWLLRHIHTAVQPLRRQAITLPLQKLALAWQQEAYSTRY